MKQGVVEAFQKAQSIFIAGHYFPDGDALGSTLALGLGLESLGKEVCCYNRDIVSYNLQFLPGVEKLTRQIPKKSFDLLVMVDCAQPKRISDDFEALAAARKNAKLVCIDHHLLDKPVGDLDWIDPKQASTGCVIWDLLRLLGIKRTPDLANLVFTTLTVDTGSFHYSNTGAGVFRLAAELLDHGASTWFVAQHLEEENPIERYYLMKLCLESLKTLADGQYCSMEITQEILKKANATSDLSEEFANIPRSIKGVEVSALFRELEDGRAKVSLRAKSRINVAQIAKNFGGGGHEFAAGCTFDSIREAKSKIEAAIQKALLESVL